MPAFNSCKLKKPIKSIEREKNMPVMNCCSHENIEPTKGWPIDCLYTNDHPEGGYNRRKLYICKNCFAVLAIPDDEFNDKYRDLRIKPREDLK